MNLSIFFPLQYIVIKTNVYERVGYLLKCKKMHRAYAYCIKTQYILTNTFFFFFYLRRMKRVPTIFLYYIINVLSERDCVNVTRDVFEDKIKNRVHIFLLYETDNSIKKKKKPNIWKKY